MVKKYILIIAVAGLLASCAKPDGQLPKSVDVEYNVTAHATWAIMTHNDPLWHTNDSVNLEQPWSVVWSSQVEPGEELILICDGFAFDSTATWVEVEMIVNGKLVFHTIDTWYPADTLREFGGSARISYDDL